MVATEHSYPAERFSGRGIVMCAGGARLLTCAWVAINVLRRVVGCSLPIELWHIGPREMGELEAALFRTLDVEIVDALERRAAWPARSLGGWELKAYSLVHSRFQEALLLDADNVAVIDPTFLFDLPQFAETGAVVWPDVVRLTRESPIWDLCGVPFRSEPAWESGQLLVDKSRCWHPLQIALHMNMHSDTFYPYTHGDKETFHLAWILAGAPWAMPEHPARLTTTAIFQRDFAGRLVFQHRSLEKWRLAGENPLTPEFHHQDECLRFLGELRERWTGSIRALPPRAPGDDETEQAIAEICWFSLEEAGSETRLLELLPGNRIGVGSAQDKLMRWYVRGGVLTLEGRFGSVPPLTPRAGTSRTFAGVGEHEIELVPDPEAGLDALGATAGAVLELLADRHMITEDDAVTTLVTLAQIGDLGYALERARSRWQFSDEALRAIDVAARRAGLHADGHSNVSGFERLH